MFIKNLFDYGLVVNKKPLPRKQAWSGLNASKLVSSPVVLKLYKHAKPLLSFPSFRRTAFLSNKTKSKNGLLKSDDLRRTPETAPSNPRVSIEPSLRTTALVHSHFVSVNL